MVGSRWGSPRKDVRGPGELSLFRRNEQNGTSGRTYPTGTRPSVGVWSEGGRCSPEEKKRGRGRQGNSYGARVACAALWCPGTDQTAVPSAVARATAATSTNAAAVPPSFYRYHHQPANNIAAADVVLCRRRRCRRRRRLRPFTDRQSLQSVLSSHRSPVSRSLLVSYVVSHARSAFRSQSQFNPALINFNIIISKTDTALVTDKPA